MSEKPTTEEMVGVVDAYINYATQNAYHRDVPNLQAIRARVVAYDRMREALALCADELDESLRNEGRLASFAEASRIARAALAEAE